MASYTPSDPLSVVRLNMDMSVHCKNGPACTHGIAVDFDDWIARFGDVSAVDIQQHGRCLACGTGGAGTITIPLDSLRGVIRVASGQQHRVEVPRQMCGRFTNKLTWGEIVALYRLTAPAPSNLRPRYNIAPTQQVLTITEDEAGRQARMMRWGLIPHWAKEPLKASTINARAETISEKPMWREPFRKRRCIIPADGFFEWKAEGNQKQPYRIERADGVPMSFAGLWAQNDLMAVVSCAIVVTAAADNMGGIHDRMPVILDGEEIDRWLAEPDLELLKPFGGELRLFPVSKAVGNVRNDGPELIEPLAL